MAEFRTNPGDRSVSELEREVDRERERVSATIDELQERASVGNLVDQIVKAVGENGGEVSRNLGRSLRDNPLPALLTGVGLAWLMAASGKPQQHPERWDEADDEYRRNLAGERYGADNPPDYASGVESADGPGLGERVSDAVGDIRQRAAETAESIGNRVADTADGLREQASDLSRSTRSQLSDAGRRVRSAGHSAGHRAVGVNREMQRGLDALLEDQPLVLGALAMAVGAAVGGALPRSRVEDRMFGTHSDRAMETVRGLAEDQGRKVQATAGAVVDEALNIADEAAAELGSRLPIGDEIVDVAEGRLREAATRLQDAGRDEAERQNLGQLPRSE